MTTLQREDRRIARLALAVGLLFMLAAAIGHCGPEPAVALAQGPRWHRTESVMLSQATVHEADWQSYGDLGAIYQTIEGSRRQGETFAQAIRRRMPNLAAGTTPRSWVLGLPVGPILRSPEGWPWRVPASHWSDRWERLQNRALGLLRGFEAGPCDGNPTRWLGRVSGRQRLDFLLASSLWVEVDCGETANSYLAPVDVD